MKTLIQMIQADFKEEASTSRDFAIATLGTVAFIALCIIVEWVDHL